MSVKKRPASGSDILSDGTEDLDNAARPGRDTEADAQELDAEALRDLSREIARDFAPVLGRTTLVLYDVDPTHLQAQWYVASEDEARAFAAFSGKTSELRQVLRLCRLDSAGRAQIVATSDQGIASEATRDQDSFEVTGDSASYECELGLESDDGGWLLIVRSNQIQVNASMPSAQGMRSSNGADQAWDRGQPIAVKSPDSVVVETALSATGAPLVPVFPNPGPVVDPEARSRRITEVEAPEEREEGGPASQAMPSAPGVSASDSGNGLSDATAQRMPSMPPPLLPSSPDSEMQTRGMSGALYDPRAALSSAALRGFSPDAGDPEPPVELAIQRGHPQEPDDLRGLPVREEADGRFSVRRTVDAALVLSLARGRDSEPKPKSEDPDTE